MAFSHFQAMFCLMMSCCYKKEFSEKIKIFNYGINVLKQKLNVTNLIKVFLDLEKLKYVLMTEDQLVLFELIKNPKIDVDLLQENSKNIDTLKNYLVNKDNILKYNRSEIDVCFERLFRKGDLLSKKILLAHTEN